MTMMADPGGLHSPPNTVTCTPPRSIIRTPGTSKLQNKKRSPLALAENFSDGGSTLKRQRGNMVESSRLQDITVNDIRSRSLKFLEQRDYNEKMKTLPCVLPPLFSAFSIYQEKQKKGMETPSRTTRKTSPCTQHIQPIFDLLLALINVEIVSMDGQHEVVPAQSKQTSTIYFSGVDCSSTQPPDDRVNGSESHQHDSIEALEAVMKIVNQFCMQKNGPVTACLNEIIEFLDDGAISGISDKIAKAVSASFPPARVVIIAGEYADEFRKIRGRISNPINTTPASHTFLKFEKRFAELLGQGIRYWLRRLFNGRPPRASAQDVDYDTWTERFSRATSLLEMKLPDGTENAAVDDECLSALISNALSILYQYFGTDFLDLSGKPPELPQGFCERPGSNQGISRGKKEGPCGLVDDLEGVILDIQDATFFLAASRAACFLSELLDVNGIDEEIKRCGGWSLVENYATLSWNYGLWKVIPHDSHLVPLANVFVLKKRLSQLAPSMRRLGKECDAALKALAKRFSLRTKSKNILARYPQIPTVSKLYHEGIECANFPSVKSV